MTKILDALRDDCGSDALNATTLTMPPGTVTTEKTNDTVMAATRTRKIDGNLRSLLARRRRHLIVVVVVVANSASDPAVGALSISIDIIFFNSLVA